MKKNSIFFCIVSLLISTIISLLANNILFVVYVKDLKKNLEITNTTISKYIINDIKKASSYLELLEDNVTVRDNIKTVNIKDVMQFTFFKSMSIDFDAAYSGSTELTLRGNAIEIRKRYGDGMILKLALNCDEFEKVLETFLKINSMQIRLKNMKHNHRDYWFSESSNILNTFSLELLYKKEFLNKVFYTECVAIGLVFFAINCLNFIMFKLFKRKLFKDIQAELSHYEKSIKELNSEKEKADYIVESAQSYILILERLEREFLFFVKSVEQEIQQKILFDLQEQDVQVSNDGSMWFDPVCLQKLLNFNELILVRRVGHINNAKEENLLSIMDNIVKALKFEFISKEIDISFVSKGKTFQVKLGYDILLLLFSFFFNIKQFLFDKSKVSIKLISKADSVDIEIIPTGLHIDYEEIATLIDKHHHNFLLTWREIKSMLKTHKIKYTEKKSEKQIKEIVLSIPLSNEQEITESSNVVFLKNAKAY